MKYEFDLDWGSQILTLDETNEHNVQWWADSLPKMLAQIRQHFEEDGIDERELIMWFEEFKRKYCERRGHRLAPTPTGAKMVKLAYQHLAPYREMVVTMSYTEYEVRKMPELYRIYEVMSGIMDIFDNYCIDDSELEALFNEGVNSNEPVTGDAVEEDEDTVPVVQTTDFSRMKSFTPITAFDMSALYSLLVEQGVIAGVDERLFSDCISHAHVNELWEIAGELRKRNLMQCLLKMLAQEWYPREWISRCASNMGKTVKKLTNPTSSGATEQFEDKLRRVLRQKTDK